MAKSYKDAETKGRVKFRIIEFELDGNDSTLQESLRSLATAIQGRNSGLPTKRMLNGTPSGTSDAVIPPSEGEDSESETDVSDESREQEPAERQSNPRGPRSYKEPQILQIRSRYTAVAEISLDAKNPEADAERYLLIAAWLKEARNIAEVGGDHIYTCYRAMGFYPPKDAVQPLRDMKKQGWFVKGAAKGTYTINHIGLKKAAGG